VKDILYLIVLLETPKGLKYILKSGSKKIRNPLLTSVPSNLYAYDKIDLSESSVVFIQKHAEKDVNDCGGPTKIPYSSTLWPWKRKASIPEKKHCKI
jgi:hypothetical protein